MSISLNKITLGTEQDQVEELVRNIDNNLINECIRITDRELNQLVDTVDIMWKGSTADEFKNKIKGDQKKFINVLHDIANRMHDDIAQMSGNVSNVDAYVATHMGGNFNSGDGSRSVSHYESDHSSINDTDLSQYDIDHPRERYSPIDYSKKDSKVVPERGGTYNWEREEFLNSFKLNPNPEPPTGFLGVLADFEATFAAAGISFVKGFSSCLEHAVDATLMLGHKFNHRDPINEAANSNNLMYISPDVDAYLTGSFVARDYTSEVFDGLYGEENDPNAIRNMAYSFETVRDVSTTAGNLAGKALESYGLSQLGAIGIVADATAGGVDTFGKYAQTNLQNTNYDIDKSFGASLEAAGIDAALSASSSHISTTLKNTLPDTGGAITSDTVQVFAADRANKMAHNTIGTMLEDTTVIQLEDTPKTPNALNYDVDSRYKNMNAVNIYEDKRYQSPTDKS